MQFSTLRARSVNTCGLCLLAAIPCLSSGQSSTAPKAPVILTPVDVIATTTAQTGDVEVNEYTGHHTRIDGPAITNSATTLAETIAHETGIQSTQAGAEGSWSTVSIRGATAAQTAIYLDGVLLNNASNGSVDLASLSLLDVAAIDIYRGETPVQLGFGGIGGAVNLLTPTALEEKTDLLLGTGSFNARKAQLSHQQQVGKLALSANINHQRSNNDFSYVNENGTPLNLNDDSRQKRTNAQFERTGLLVKAGYQHSESLRYDGSFQYSNRLQGVPHWRNFAGTRTTFDTEAVQLQLNQRINGLAQSDWNTATGLYITRNAEVYDDRQSLIGLGTQFTSSQVDTLGIRAYQEYIGNRGTLAINHDIRQETLSQLDRISDSDFDTQRRQLTGAMQYSWFSDDERWILTPALRYSTLSDEYDGARVNELSSYQATRFAPQIGFKWQHSSRLTLTANAGKHFREPVFFELFGDRGLFTGNDSLTAEEGINVDAGIAWQDASNGRQLRLSVFRNTRDNLIVNTFNAQGVGRAENIGDALIRGLEASAQWQLSPHLNLTLNASLLSPRNQSANAAFSGKTLPGVAKTTAYAYIEYKRASWRWWFASDLIHDRYYDEANLLPAKDQLIHSTGVGFQRDRMRISLLLHNLGDDNTEDINGYPKPGRSFQLNVTYSLHRNSP